MPLADNAKERTTTSGRLVGNSVIGAILVKVRSRQERTFPPETAVQRPPISGKRSRPVI